MTLFFHWANIAIIVDNYHIIESQSSLHLTNIYFPVETMDTIETLSQNSPHQ